MKLLLSLLFIAISSNSEAQLRCFNLFETKQSYAQVIDSINSSNRNEIFENDLEKFLNPDLANKSFLEKYKLHRQASKLSKNLKELKNAGDWTEYDFDHFTKRLLQLSFLTDTTVMNQMSSADKIIYVSARQKVLSTGLKNFFFQERKTPTSVKRKVFDWIMYPFQDIYMRWTMAPFYMPKLNGPGMDLADAQKLLWEGFENCPDIIQKYSLLAPGKNLFFYLTIFQNPQAKHYFNRASSFYNWGLLTALLAGAPMYIYFTAERLQDEGNKHAAQMIAPMLNHSKEVANINYHQLAAEKDFINMVDNFKSAYHRDPSPNELELIRKVIQENNN